MEKKPRKIIISLCLDNIDKDNGPTELYEKSHIEELPYWKFLLNTFLKRNINYLLTKEIYLLEKHLFGTEGRKIIFSKIEY